MKTINRTTLQVAHATRTLAVTVLLSLGLESTTRSYTLALSPNTNNNYPPIDEQAEALKLLAYAKTKYTSILHMGGSASILSTTIIEPTTL